MPAGNRPPTESPHRQRSGLAATEEWRPGRRRATRLPTEERSTQRACKSSVWVRVTTPSRRGGTQALCNSTLTQPGTGGGWSHRPTLQGYVSPAGPRPLLLFFRWSPFNHGDVVENFVVDRLSEAVAPWVQKVVRDCRASFLKRRSQT